MDDTSDHSNPTNVIYPTEAFSNRYAERIADREIPYSLEPQVLTDLIANGYKPKYPANAIPLTKNLVLFPIKNGKQSVNNLAENGACL